MDAGYVLLTICGSSLVWFLAKDVYDRVHKHGPPGG